MVEARATTALSSPRWFSAPDSGYSVDNLPPAVPAPFTGQYVAGTASLHWNRNLEADLAASPADIAVIGTPAPAAQEVANRLVRAGVRALLNFAPVTLVAPPEVAITNVNMALELEALSFALTRRRA